MPFVLLLLAFLLYVQDSWAPPRFDWTPQGASFATLGGIGAFVILAGLMSLAIGQSLRLAPYNRYAILKRFGRWRKWHFFAYSAFFVAALYFFGWGWAVVEVTGESPFVKLMVLVPYLVGLVLAWGFFYDVDRAGHAMLWLSDESRFPSRGAYLMLNIRHNMMLMAPPVVLMTAQDALTAIFPQLRSRDQFPIFTLAVLMGLMGSAILFIPWLLRVFLGLKPLPAGPLRDHLTATAKRIHFRFSDVLVWNTGHTVANAMVTGIVPMLRYVVLTDRIIQELSQEEIEGVFGHEVGHIKHHHMTLYTLFLLLSLVMLGGLWSFGVDIATAYLGGNWPWVIGVIDHHEWFLGVVVVYVFLVFGLLSRHCERQADLYGCNVSSREAFIHALEKVADINGMNREKPGFFSSWQHWTIGQRVAFLRSLDSDPSLEAKTQRRIGMLKWSLTLGLLAGVIVLLSTNPWNWLKYL